MKAYLFLFIAIISEIVGTTSLKVADGFTRLIPTAIAMVGYGVSFYFLSLCLRYLSLGVVYTIWSGLGTAGVVLIGFWVWRETLCLQQVIGIVLVIVGTILLSAMKSQAA